jgi:membrane fusion protein, copper/silver efflux system
MKRISLIVSAAILVLGGIALTSCKKGDHTGHKGASTQQATYHCPMHPTYVSDKPGDCPICGMRLVPIESEESHEQAVKGAQGQDSKPLYYRHPMNPEITSPEPKKDEMGMDYVAVYHEDAGGSAGGAQLPDRVPVKLSAERQQLIGVRTAAVEVRNLESVVRASGRVAYDPDLYNAIAEHRQALEARDKVKDSPWPDVKERSEALIQSSALRLRQMGLSKDQIKELSFRTEDPTNLLLSDKGGSVWVYAQIYEYETGIVKRGQMMEVTSSAFPGKSFRGKVVAVDSILNPETRTLKVRGEVPNPEGLLKPEMYVDTSILIDLGRKLAIPEEAVLKTGTRQIVFVEVGAGQFEPREIKVGGKAEDHYEVVSGVKEGEKVVTSANFLIDSESKLKSALSGAGGGHSH